MKVCIYGAGAIGGNLAARLGAVPGVELSVIARGAQLRAIRQGGITLWFGGRTHRLVPDVATDDPSELPPQDMVFVTLKATDQGAIAQPLSRLVAQAGHAVFVCNGIPWWWTEGLPSPRALTRVDPGGVLWQHFGAHRALGCVVHSGNEVVCPGIVRHFGNDNWLVGEPRGHRSARLDATVDLMRAAGLDAKASSDVRADVWRKLMKNAAYNPVCALTRLPLEWLSDDGAVVGLVHSMIDEVHAIASGLGYDTESARDAARVLPIRPAGLTFEEGQRPSMLQDVLAGRPLEVEALLGQVVAFATELQLPCPSLLSVLALVRGLDRAREGSIAAPALDGGKRRSMVDKRDSR